MRCSLCLGMNLSGRTKCVVCGARLAEEAHRLLAGVGYLLDEVGRWEAQKRYTPEILGGLKQEYGTRRDGLRLELRPASPPVPSPTASPSMVTALRVEPMRPVAPVRLADPPPPPKPPFAWKNLYTERNIRWVLNLGIFIFSVALAVFIHTQWKEMSPKLKVGILYGASFASIGAGHLLRRTILKSTGLALVLLGAIAIPIDCAALVQFRIVEHHDDQVGLWGSLLSLAVYAGLAWLYKERRFIHMATLAAASMWAFLLRSCGMSWPSVAPWVAPLALAGVCAGKRDVRLPSCGILLASLALTVGFLLAGKLSPSEHLLALEVALGSGLAAMVLAEGRTKRAGFQWGTVAFLVAMYAVAAAHSHLHFWECWLSLTLLGTAFGGGWFRRSRAFATAGIMAGALSLLAALPDSGRLAWALAIPAALHAVCGLAKNDERHAFAGWLLAGAALLCGMDALHIPRLHQPLALAGYGALMVAISHGRTPQSLRILGTLGAGAAMLLLAAWYPLYYLPKAFPGAVPPPGGQACQLLGASIALVAALAFGPLANAQRSRFLSDITYGCLGFSYVLALRWAHVPGKWLGIGLALFGFSYALLENRISKWLLRPTFFTGIACTVAAAVLAFLQWFVHHEYLQSSLTFFLVGGFYFAAASRTSFKGLYHVGVYLATAGWLVAMQGLGVFPEVRALLTLIPAGLALMFAARARVLHLGLSSLVVTVAALAMIYLDPTTYLDPRLPYAIAASVAAAVLAGWFAFSGKVPREVDDRVMSGLMAAFASAAYVLWLEMLATGRPWGGLVIFQMSLLLGASAELLRRKGFIRQGPPMILVSLMTTALALYTCHVLGFGQGVHLWGYLLAALLYTALGWTFKRAGFAWAGAAAGAAGLLFWLTHGESTRWLGVWTFPLAALALLRRDRPLRALGLLALLVCPAHAAVHLHDWPEVGLVFLAMAGALACTRLHAFSLWPMILGTGLSLGDPTWGMVVAFSGFAMYLALSLLKQRPPYLHVSLVLALLGDWLLALNTHHAGLVAYPLALVLFAMAREVSKRYGPVYGWPLLGAGFAAALLATALGFPQEDDRILVLLADTLLFGASAVAFRRPELMYPCSAALVALDIALMLKFHLRPTQVALQLVTLALAKVIFVRAMGGRMVSYLKPVYVASLLIAAGVLLFGFSHHAEYTERTGDIDLAIWGLMLIALTMGIAGRIRRIPAFLYLAAAHLLGAYYLALYKYEVGVCEAYTLPIAAGLGLWALLGLGDKGARAFVEGLSLAMLFLPSSFQSFDHSIGAIHTLYALALAFSAVLAGMVMRRRVYLFGGTGAFILEVAGKALQFLIDQKLSVAGWGMILGGLMILLAALFESRKARIVHDQIELMRAGAQKYFATWE